MTRGRGCWLFGLVAASLCTSAHAGGGPAADAYEGTSAGALDLQALADVYVLHDFNNPPSGLTTLRQFDLAVDRPALEYLRLTLAHQPRPLGFRIDAGVGDTADVYRLDDPELARHPELARAFSYIEQAFVTVTIPVGRGLSIDAGKFVTPAGFEDNETIANWNYSRSFLYSWAEPSLHTGVRASLPLTSKVAASLFWLNGWNANWVDGNDLRSFAVAVGAQPLTTLDLSITYLAGLERAPTALADPTLHWRNLASASGAWSVTSWLTLALAADYGDDRARGGVRFGGVTGYVRVEPLRWLATTVRGEYYADPSGFTTGTAQSLGAVTATLDLYRHEGAAQLFLRLEYRHDQSSARPFPTPAGPVATQDTLTLALTGVVTTKPPR
jgi:putative OmpL-like beta-barrel porin-2